MTNFRVLGHRGAILKDAPIYQNTQAAFAEALTFGDGFETDACASKDGAIFLIHEAKYVKAETGVEYCIDEHLQPESVALVAGRKIEQMTSAEMRQLRLHDGSPIPELTQTMQQVARHPGKILNIELKGHDVLRHVLRDMELGLIGQEQIVLSSFNHLSLVKARQALPKAQIGAIFVAADTAPAPLFPWHPGSAGQYCPLNEASLSQPILQQAKPDYVVLPDMELSLKNVEMIDRFLPQARIFAWVFTERGGTDPQKMLQTVADLRPTSKLAGLMVDNPRQYAAPLHAAAAGKPTL